MSNEHFGFGSHGNGFNGGGNATYSFTLTSGAITAVAVTETHGSRSSTHSVDIGPTTSYTVGTDGKITETSVVGNAVETTVYVAGSTAGQYTIQSETHTYIAQGTATTRLDVEPYDRAKFTIGTGGAVTAVDRVLPDGSTKSVTIGSATTYTQLAAGYVLEVQTHGSHSNYEVYHDGNGDGIYTEIAHGSGSTVDLVGLQTQVSSINGVL
ncbi:hypothetical protein GTP58_00195 [Duganella sp. CY15W]|uniref:hypothetical protein n=1 Tax=Duganella sp. CY15W TaxID=2692172 RepID=UPI001371899D|nr:hypothetical protein [Duganella sp. CY15W]MYM26736.1 hypothetical protein [Duganella sp. CY15W]